MSGPFFDFENDDISEDEINSDGVYNELLDEIRDNRKEYDSMLNSIAELRKKTCEVLPEPMKNSNDFRNKNKYNKFAMEETMKAISNVFTTELNIRKSKENSIKLEIDLRRKLTGENESEEVQQKQIEKIAKVLEKMETDKEKIVN